MALSPSGKQLFVAEWAEGSISVIDTDTLEITATITSPNNPRAIAVTNDGDSSDDDEALIVAEFFGEPVPGGEGTDTGRLGRLRIYRLVDLAPSNAITLAPIDSGFAPVDGQPTILTSPNQIYAIAINGERVYATSVSASPEPPVKFNGNVQPVVYVGDLSSRLEVRGGSGSANLARLVADRLEPGTNRHFLADIVDLAFATNTDIAYVVSRGSNVVQRVVYGDNNITLGSANNVQIDVGATPAGSEAGCTAPNGITMAHDAPRAFLSCKVSRRLGTLDMASQQLISTTSSALQPTTPAEIAHNRGEKFFFTGRARWSKESWSACSSCHPDGLSDGITWQFAAGPRQTTSLDGSFSKGPGPQVMRVLNWTGIFDELHDFERNTRGVSGGLGAVTSGNCGVLAEESQLGLTSNLGQPIKEIQDGPTACTSDWDDIEAWVRTVRPPRALRNLDPAAVARGAALFGSSATGNNGDCNKCHGGPGFTASRLFWEPSSDTNAALAATPFVAPVAWPLAWNSHTLQIAAQPDIADLLGAAVGPAQTACVLRNVGTFGIPGDVTLTDALEQKPNQSRAQGAGGYNVPSLYGLAVGAPFLHHGQAADLAALFSDSKWAAHMTAGNAVFAPSEQDKSDLADYLLSLDADAPEIAIPAGFDGCPLTFP